MVGPSRTRGGDQELFGLERGHDALHRGARKVHALCDDGKETALKKHDSTCGDRSGRLPDRHEIHFLRKVEALLIVDDLTAMRTTGARFRWDSNSPLMKCKLPGPQEPAQAVGFPRRLQSHR